MQLVEKAFAAVERYGPTATAAIIEMIEIAVRFDDDNLVADLDRLLRCTEVVLTDELAYALHCN